MQQRDPNRDLFEAARTGDINRAFGIIDTRDGADFNARKKVADDQDSQSNGYTPLMEAIVSNQKAFTRWLVNNYSTSLDICAQSTGKKQSALHLLSRSNDIELAKLLIETNHLAHRFQKNCLYLQNKAGRLPIHEAAFEDNLPLLKLMLSFDSTLLLTHTAYGETIHGIALKNAETPSKRRIQDFLEQREAEKSTYAILPLGYIDRFIPILFDSDKQLFEAATMNDLPRLKKAIAWSANINVRDSANCTALIAAANHSFDDIVLELLKHKKKLDTLAQNDAGLTALHVAVHKQNKPIVRLLLAADPTALKLADHDGNTPLHSAIQNNDKKMCKELLAPEENHLLSIKNKQGFMPPQLAMALGHLDLAAYLIAEKCFENDMSQYDLDLLLELKINLAIARTLATLDLAAKKEVLWCWQMASFAERLILHDLHSKGLCEHQFLEVLQGGFLIIPDSNGAYYQKWERECLTRGREKASSHDSAHPQFSVQGPFCKEILVGTMEIDGCICTWLQCESHPVDGPENIAGHGISYALYKMTGKNQGPHGASDYTEKNPMIASFKQVIHPAALDIPAACTDMNISRKYELLFFNINTKRADACATTDAYQPSFSHD